MAEALGIVAVLMVGSALIEHLLTARAPGGEGEAAER